MSSQMDFQRTPWPSLEFLWQYAEVFPPTMPLARTTVEYAQPQSFTVVTEEEIEATLPAPPLAERGFGT